MPNANEVQYGGDHYKSLPVEPWDFITANGIGFLDGNAIKYLARWRQKGGVEDLRKARHYIDKLIEIEAGKESTAEETPQRGIEVNEQSTEGCFCKQMERIGQELEEALRAAWITDGQGDEPKFIPPTEAMAPDDHFELREVDEIDYAQSKPIGHLVLVEWRDALHHGGWQPYQEAHDATISRCRSVGWLVAADDDRVVLSASREDESGEVSDSLVIPTQAMQRMCVFEAVETLGGPSSAWGNGPAVRKWIPLEDLKPGLVFMTEDGVMAVKAHGHEITRGVICTLLAGSAEPKHCKPRPGGAVVLPGGELVIALEVEQL